MSAAGVNVNPANEMEVAFAKSFWVPAIRSFTRDCSLVVEDMMSSLSSVTKWSGLYRLPPAVAAAPIASSGQVAFLAERRCRFCRFSVRAEI